MQRSFRENLRSEGCNSWC